MPSTVHGRNVAAALLPILRATPQVVEALQDSSVTPIRTWYDVPGTRFFILAFQLQQSPASADKSEGPDIKYTAKYYDFDGF